ncbi:unnamed protein product [Caenorhabditis bovis]|uniref:DUF4773 domain-containing protein n=1 Tax=Caenorhabditis bovis TaxID=2654633 RepID=A0A8S1EUQ3_9PELO|nr:unnamed protein product [Caenorhabditis bovis]
MCQINEQTGHVATDVQALAKYSFCNDFANNSPDLLDFSIWKCFGSPAIASIPFETQTEFHWGEARNLTSHSYAARVSTRSQTDALILEWNRFDENAILENEENAGGCHCVKGNCACCINTKLPKFKHSVCVNATYNPVTIGLDLSIGIDGHFFTQEISIRNPPPICVSVPIPEAEHIAGICIAFTDMDIDRKSKILSGCVEFEVELVHLRIIKVKIGCFEMPI